MRIAVSSFSLLTVMAYTACSPAGKGFSTSRPLSSIDQSSNAGLPTPDNDSSRDPASIGNSTSYFSNFVLPSGTNLNQLESDFINPVSSSGEDNRYSTAIFGMAKESLKYNTTDLSYETLQIPTQYMNNGMGSLVVQLYKSRDSSLRKAPLAVVLNPLYSGEFDSQMTRYIDYFGKRGFHVLVVVSPWSPDVTTRSPDFMPGDVWTEARMIMEVTDKVVRENLGRENVRGATLIGMSYGAFLAAIVKSYDARTEQPLIDGPTVLLNPPHDIIHSLKNIDRQVSETTQYAFECILGGGINGLVTQILEAQDYNSVDWDETCSKYSFTQAGFNATLVATVGILNLTKDLGLTTSEVLEVTYETYLYDLAKINPKAGESDLGYWMAESKMRGYSKFIVLSSDDDNINEGNNLNQNSYYNFNDSNWVRLTKGGHTGFRSQKSKNPNCGSDWNHCLMNAIYP